MLRAILCSLLAVALVTGSLMSAPKGAKAGKNQKKQNGLVIKGTIKSIDLQTAMFVINQKNKKQTTDRELTVNDQTRFEIGGGKGGNKNITGRAGLKLLTGHEGDRVLVKCDPNSKVLKVTILKNK